jgi:hypothetical protein
MKTLVEKEPRFQPSYELHPSDEEFEAGRRAGYYTYADFVFPRRAEFTALGRTFFVRDRPFCCYQPPILTVKSPVRVKILDITGVEEGINVSFGEKDKEMDYVYGWDLDGFPAGLHPAFQEFRKRGSATFRRFDDGWRIIYQK